MATVIREGKCGGAAMDRNSTSWLPCCPECGSQPATHTLVSKAACLDSTRLTDMSVSQQGEVACFDSTQRKPAIDERR